MNSSRIEIITRPIADPTESPIITATIKASEGERERERALIKQCNL